MTALSELVTRARAVIENLTPADVARERDTGDVLLVDVREPHETRQGVLAGAILVPRGRLEFNADAASPHHIAGFRRERRVIVYSTAGMRSALSACALQELGYHDVAHLEGGYRTWVDQGRPVAHLHGEDQE